MPETIRIPISAPTAEYFQFVAACGTVETDDAQLLAAFDALNARNDIVAELSSSDEQSIVRLFGGNTRRKGRHLHLEVGRLSYFGNRAPKVNADLAAIEAILGTFNERKIRVALTNRYSIPSARVAPRSFIRSVLMKEILGEHGIKIRQRGATFAFEKAPIEHLSWYVGETTTNVEVNAITSLTVSSEYLNELYSLADSAFKTFVLDEPDRRSVKGASDAATDR